MVNPRLLMLPLLLSLGMYASDAYDTEIARYPHDISADEMAMVTSNKEQMYVYMPSRVANAMQELALQLKIRSDELDCVLHEACIMKKKALSYSTVMSAVRHLITQCDDSVRSKECVVELIQYLSALESGDATLRVEEERDGTTRASCKVFCRLVVRGCIQAGCLNVDGNVTIGGNLTVNGDTLLNNLTATGDTNLTDLTVSGDTNLTNLTVTGDTILNNATITNLTVTNTFIANINLIYAYVYTLSMGGIVTVAPGGDVIFDTNGPISPGITHSTTVAPEMIIFNVAGTYSIDWTMTDTLSAEFQLYLNGTTPIAGTPYGQAVLLAGVGALQTSGISIIQVAAGDFITLRNVSVLPYVFLDLSTLLGIFGPPPVAAGLKIVRVGS